jgi:hypothetical protein
MTLLIKLMNLIINLTIIALTRTGLKRFKSHINLLKELLALFIDTVIIFNIILLRKFFRNISTAINISYYDGARAPPLQDIMAPLYTT